MDSNPFHKHLEQAQDRPYDFFLPLTENSAYLLAFLLMHLHVCLFRPLDPQPKLNHRQHDIERIHLSRMEALVQTL